MFQRHLAALSLCIFIHFMSAHPETLSHYLCSNIIHLHKPQLYVNLCFCLVVFRNISHLKEHFVVYNEYVQCAMNSKEEERPNIMRCTRSTLISIWQ